MSVSVKYAEKKEDRWTINKICFNVLTYVFYTLKILDCKNKAGNEVSFFGRFLEGIYNFKIEK